MSKDKEETVESHGLLEGKVVIVTGAGAGIGAETAKALAHAGASVSLAARTASHLEAVTEEITRVGGNAQATPTDVSNPEQVDRLIRETLKRFSRVDFLINNAGTPYPTGRPAWETDPREWRKAMEINIFGVYLASRATIPHMLKEGFGRVINVSSTLSEVPGANKSAYCTGKAAINQFTRVLATELLGTGVTVNAYDPGAVRTAMLNVMTPEGVRRTLMTREPREAAAEIVWLCSPGASYLTGQFVRWWNPFLRMGTARLGTLQEEPRWATGVPPQATLPRWGMLQ
jgi:NAD(P)-dependent dehydrogenase (short-subunit alcohol dehydrogenase family)